MFLPASRMRIEEEVQEGRLMKRCDEGCCDDNLGNLNKLEETMYLATANTNPTCAGKVERLGRQ
jgi:hypothetical protein